MVKVPQPSCVFGCRARKRKAIQIPWDLDEGMPGKIVQKLLEEHCHLNLSITAQEADYIVDLIAQKLPCNYNAVYRTVSAPHCPQKTAPWVAEGAPRSAGVAPRR